jgi:hypothetical protein
MSTRLPVIAARMLALVALAGWSGLAHAQGVGQSLILDPSIRAAGMGGASAAVFWGGDPNYWANAALLGSIDGLRFEWGRTPLTPDLATDVQFNSARFTIGAYGVGIFTAGRPAGIGGLKLDYGESQTVDQNGNPTGTFDSFEHINAWGFGINVGELLRNAIRAGGADPPPFDRFADIAWGKNLKKVKVQLAPGEAPETSTQDHGVMARVTPYNSLDYPGMLPGFETHVRSRFDVSYGDAVTNATRADIQFSGQTPAALVRVPRHGWAGRFVATPTSWLAARREGHTSWLADVLTPLVSVTGAWDHYNYECPDGTCGSPPEVATSGWELSVANVVALRTGHVKDLYSSIDGTSYGWGLGMQLHRVGGVRYDEAYVPTPAGQSKLHRKGFAVYLDPIGFYQRWQETHGQ